MPDPSITASGERFARDMRRIREENGVSMEDIHDETMISTHIIESFEQDGLFEHPTFNRVYLRSFMRSYANAAGIDPERALEGLAHALEGTYANELAVEYLGDEPMEPVSPPQPEGEEGSEERSAEATASKEASSKKSEAGRAALSGSAPKSSSSSSADAASSADQESPDGLPAGSRRGIAIGIGIVLVAIAAWVLVDTLRGSNATTSSQASSAAVDSADSIRLEPIPAESLRVDQPRVAIGDTMYFTIIAQERMNPIRIRRDEDLRRPYYFNRGQAGVFPAEQQIILEGDLSNIRLLVNGHEYPVEERMASGNLVLSRDTVQVFLDTTQTMPLSLVVPADTFQVLGE